MLAKIVNSAMCVLLALAATPLLAQTSSNELSAYTSAVARVHPAERLAQLEHFAIDASPGPLKVQALEFVIWAYLSQHSTAHALTWADALSNVDKDNAIALAVLSNRARTAVDAGAMKPRELLAMASRGLNHIQELQRPLGMNMADFENLRREAYAMLSGAAGAAELKMKDYVAAREYLHNATAVDPNNPRYVYPLGLADLSGPDRNMKEGYWSLARAVDLSRGTTEGMEIARYARDRYVNDGGSTQQWNDYLASAAGTRAPSATTTTMVAAARPPTTVARPAMKSAVPVTNASVKQPPIAPLGKNKGPSVWADNTTQPVIRKRHIPAATGPMSLGLLVETSLTNRENRKAVVDSLIDMLRHLNDRDEAFILTYDNNLVFQQDLTTDPKQLEDALEGIKPQKGAVLDDAIAFAAGHLSRIAKYPNRVLLVISDGRNIDSQTSPIQTSSEINAAGVRIYCIGMDVNEAYGRYRLQELSASTGGQSSFISSPGQFRSATEQMAKNMGIDFRF